jgi:hypothetical protein
VLASHEELYSRKLINSDKGLIIKKQQRKKTQKKEERNKEVKKGQNKGSKK